MREPLGTNGAPPTLNETIYQQFHAEAFYSLLIRNKAEHPPPHRDDLICAKSFWILSLDHPDILLTKTALI